MGGSCGWFPMRRDEVKEWVAAHREELPTTLVGLSAFPILFRTMIVKSLSPGLRTKIWREHLATFVGGDSTLSPAQQEFVVQSAERMSTLLSAPAPNPTIVDWEAQMGRLFSRAEAGRIFGTIGPPEPPEGLPLPPDAKPTR